MVHFGLLMDLIDLDVESEPYVSNARGGYKIFGAEWSLLSRCPLMAIVKFTMVLFLPNLNGCYILGYWCTQHALMLNLSYKFRMLEEIYVVEAG